MKFSIALFAVAMTGVAVDAFAPVAFGTRSVPTAIYADAAQKLIREAMEATKKFGGQSQEARLAWEAVEEVNAADNSEATKGSLADECDISSEKMAAACEEYSKKMEALERLLDSQPFAVSPTANTEGALQVDNVKLATPTAPRGKASVKLQEALQEARAATAEYGITSSQAQVAWETVEEIAAADNSSALGGKLDDEECLVDAAIEACQALGEFNRALNTK